MQQLPPALGGVGFVSPIYGVQAGAERYKTRKN